MRRCVDDEGTVACPTWNGNGTRWPPCDRELDSVLGAVIWNTRVLNITALICVFNGHISVLIDLSKKHHIKKTSIYFQWLFQLQRFYSIV